MKITAKTLRENCAAIEKMKLGVRETVALTHLLDAGKIHPHELAGLMKSSKSQAHAVLQVLRRKGMAESEKPELGPVVFWVTDLAQEIID